MYANERRLCPVAKTNITSCMIGTRSRSELYYRNTGMSVYLIHILFLFFFSGRLRVAPPGNTLVAHSRHQDPELSSSPNIRPDRICKGTLCYTTMLSSWENNNLSLPFASPQSQWERDRHYTSIKAVLCGAVVGPSEPWCGTNFPTDRTVYANRLNHRGPRDKEATRRRRQRRRRWRKCFE